MVKYYWSTFLHERRVHNRTLKFIKPKAESGNRLREAGQTANQTKIKVELTLQCYYPDISVHFTKGWWVQLTGKGNKIAKLGNWPKIIYAGFLGGLWYSWLGGRTGKDREQNNVLIRGILGHLVPSMLGNNWNYLLLSSVRREWKKIKINNQLKGKDVANFLLYWTSKNISDWAFVFCLHGHLLCFFH